MQTFLQMFTVETFHYLLSTARSFGVVEDSWDVIRVNRVVVWVTCMVWRKTGKGTLILK